MATTVQKRLENTFDWCAEKFREHPEQYERVAGLLKQEIDRREREIRKAHEEIRTRLEENSAAYIEDLKEEIAELKDAPPLALVPPLKLQNWWIGGMVVEQSRRAKAGEPPPQPERIVIRSPIRQLVQDFQVAQEKAVDTEIVTLRRDVRKMAGENGRRQRNIVLWQQVALARLAQKMAGEHGLGTALAECADVMARRFALEKDSLSFDKAHDRGIKMLRFYEKVAFLQQMAAEAEARITGQTRAELLAQAIDVGEGGAGASSTDLPPEVLAQVLRDGATALEGLAALPKDADQSLEAEIAAGS